jgi:hypothetical protein
MKSNKRLYLPWSVVAEWMTPIAKVQPGPQLPLASVEQLDGGCVLSRLAAQR